MKYLSWLKYSYEILLVNQWKDVKFINCERSFNATCRYNNGDDVLKQFNMKKVCFEIIFGLNLW